MKIIGNRIYFINLVIIVLFFLFGCNTTTQQGTNLSEIQAYKKQMAEREIEHAEQLRLAEDTAIAKIEGLNKKIEELTSQLETVQAELEECQNKPKDILELQQKYEKLLTENEQLRELVEYERGLREQLLKKVEQDQITISQLKNRLDNN